MSFVFIALKNTGDNACHALKVTSVLIIIVIPAKAIFYFVTCALIKYESIYDF